MDHAVTHAERARFKVLGTILTTYGFAIMGGSIIQPLLSAGQGLTLLRVSGIVLALVFQAAAIYIAPKGEKP